MHANSTGILNNDIDIEEKERQSVPEYAVGVFEAEVGSMAGCFEEEPSSSVKSLLRDRHSLQFRWGPGGAPLLKVFPSVFSPWSQVLDDYYHIFHLIPPCLQHIKSFPVQFGVFSH